MSKTYAALPALSPEQGLSRYLGQIRKFPMLEPEQEFMLAKAWVDHEDRDSAHQLVTSHLRLARQDRQWAIAAMACRRRKSCRRPMSD